MLYRNYQIELWKSDWVGRRINGEWYSLDVYSFVGKEAAIANNDYIALIQLINPPRSFGIYGGSTPKIALDLAKFAIDLHEFNWSRFSDMIERYNTYNKKCLEQRLKRRSENI
jgi:hypothetical protein